MVGKPSIYGDAAHGSLLSLPHETNFANYRAPPCTNLPTFVSYIADIEESEVVSTLQALHAARSEKNPHGEHRQKWSACNVCVLKLIMSFMAASRRSTITVPHRIGNSWVPCMSPNLLSKPNGCDPRVCPSEIRIWGVFGARCKVGCISQSIPINLLYFFPYLGWFLGSIQKMVELICFFVEYLFLLLNSPSWLLRTWSQLCLLVEFHPTGSFSTNGPSEFRELCTSLWPCHQNWSIPICLDLGSPPLILQVFNTLCLSHSPIPMDLKKPSKLQITPKSPKH